ncbi:MAG TPA: glycoside hydrolase family 2 protein [Streptosporangiaceae bacterium]
MTYRALDRDWTLRPIGGEPHIGPEPVPATVPGCVHTDLLAAGLIPDPYLDDNELRLGWIGRTDWVYETAFDWTPDGAAHTDLVCEGLDTVATVELNGVALGTTANMHRAYRFDATAALRPGVNRLAVRFAAPYGYTERLRAELGDRPGAYPEPYNFIRKMACNFGWDWGPTLVTVGIWRPIGLRSWSGARLAAIRPQVSGDGRVTVHAALDRTGEPGGAGEPGELALTATIAGRAATVAVPAGQATATVELKVDAPELWWPRGYGAQPLYDLDVTLTGAGGVGRPLDRWRRRVGFRDVHLDTTPDEYGSACTIVVNGVPVFARGANWIPDDCFPTRVTPERYAARLAQACEAGINLVRVWGGGLYESDAFYDRCDELGLLVWQDFPFACAAYPEEGPFPAEVEAEARENITRLAPHPSLAVWCGNNENLVGYAAWGWRDRLAGRTWGAGYYYDLLPRLVAELDPSRPYLPGSPYSGDPAVHPDELGHGTAHIWDVWNQRDYAAYREKAPRFAAEFGFQGPATYATLRRAITGEPLTPDGPLLLHHQKADDGEGKLARGLEPYFPKADTFDDWHFLAQLNQARAITLGVEHFRSLWPVCAGTVVWQLNDCWPVISWAAIDGDGRRKPLWYALRRAYADRLLTVQPRDGGLALAAVNDTDEEWELSAQAVRHDFCGRVLAVEALTLTVPRRQVGVVPIPPAVASPGDPATELLAVSVADRRALWFFAPDKDLALPAPDFAATVRRCPAGAEVTLTARVLLRDVCLFADRLDPAAEVDDMLVTLLPGESAHFRVTAPAPLDPDALISPPVLRTVNDIVHGAP